MRSRNHVTGLDGVWEVSNATGLQHWFHGICPNFTGLVCTGSVFKKPTGRDRDLEHFHGISLDGNGIFNFLRVTRLSRIPCNPAGFLYGKNSEESPVFFPSPRSSFVRNVAGSNSRIVWMTVFAQIWLVLFNETIPCTSYLSLYECCRLSVSSTPAVVRCVVGVHDAVSVDTQGDSSFTHGVQAEFTGRLQTRNCALTIRYQTRTTE